MLATYTMRKLQLPLKFCVRGGHGVRTAGLCNRRRPDGNILQVDASWRRHISGRTVMTRPDGRLLQADGLSWRVRTVGFTSGCVRTVNFCKRTHPDDACWVSHNRDLISAQKNAKISSRALRMSPRVFHSTSLTIPVASAILRFFSQAPENVNYTGKL